jgi:hypothetical protein
MSSSVDALIQRLEDEAHRRKISKKALADMARVHPNSLRSFRGFGARGDGKVAWSPTTAVLRKVEAALFPNPATSVKRKRLQPMDNTTQGNGEAAI